MKNYSSTPRFDWSTQEIEEIYNLSFPDLIYAAQSIHRETFSPTHVQCSSLLSIKTGGCPEDCKYCPQSAHYDTGLERQDFLDEKTVLAEANKAKVKGATRFCMGVAWREVKEGKNFDHILNLVRGVRALDLEVCCTLGMLTESQAQALKEAGCYAYNHNLDTSPEYYGEIITTRTYDDRLNTLRNVRKSGMTVCCGGILGLGEGETDRFGLLRELAAMSPHPESVPVNLLVKVEGTPLSEEDTVGPIQYIRFIATTRIVMPTSYVRLSAGRSSLSNEAQALCFIAGANSIFLGEKLLTTENPHEDEDRKLLRSLGMDFQSSPSDSVRVAANC